MPVKWKTRNKSSKDSTPAADEKKTRTEAGCFSSQTDDEVFEALNLAEDLGKKIEHVLLKLGKLDIIESHLQDINSTLANIEQTVSRLDEEVKILKVKTNDTDEVVKALKESLEFNEDNISVWSEARLSPTRSLWTEETAFVHSRRENSKVFDLPPQMVGKECKMAASSRRLQRRYLQLFRGTPPNWPAPWQNRISKSTPSWKTFRGCKTASKFCKILALWW